MTDWICPACGGGFPDEEMLRGQRTDGSKDEACPWCAYSLNTRRDLDEYPSEGIRTGTRAKLDEGTNLSIAEILSLDEDELDEKLDDEDDEAR